MKAMIIPGIMMGISKSWIPSVKQGLGSLGLEVIAENMPDRSRARKEHWLPFIEERLSGSEDNILVGYSSGAVAALRYLETHKARGAVLVAPHYTDGGSEMEKNTGYFNDPWKWSDIQENVQWISQFASTDDPFIPLDESRFIAKTLDTKYQEMDGCKHFYEMTEFPEVVEAVREGLDL